MNTICLRDDEARQLAQMKSGDELLLLRVMKPQPPEDCTEPEISTGYDDVEEFNYAMFVWQTKEGKDVFVAEPPYVVGQEIGVRETWSIRIGTPHVYVYKSDGIDNRWLREGKRSWSSPRTMPPEAIKRHLILEGIFCKQVQKVTDHEWWLSGASMNWDWDKNGKLIELKDDPDTNVIIYVWNSLHAKPVEGKDGYECYPWDMNSLISIYRNTKYYGYLLNLVWNDKPLKICANPFVFGYKVRMK